jgi:hypothetical protein
MIPMKHFDELPGPAFTAISNTVDRHIKKMIEEVNHLGICPGCFCNLIAETARTAAKAYEESKHAETEH